MKSYETFDGISYGMPYGPMTWNPLEYHHMKCMAYPMDYPLGSTMASWEYLMKSYGNPRRKPVEYPMEYPVECPIEYTMTSPRISYETL